MIGYILLKQGKLKEALFEFEKLKN